MRKKIKKIIGVILIVIGITGWFVPIFQGWLFIFLGVALIENQWVNKKCKILKQKCDKFWHKYFRK